MAAMAATSALYYSIDVECVATGTDHNSRAVAAVAVVDATGALVLDLVVKPAAPVVSYLTALTGLTPDLVQRHGVPLADAVAQVRGCLPPSAVLVGQNILQDVQWLGLKEGVDYGSCMDLAGLYRIWNPKYNSYSVFSQDHLCAVLLGAAPQDLAQHSAAGDAAKSMALFHRHAALQADPAAWAAAQGALLAAPPAPSFAKRNPSYEGVCMGNRRTCTCGAPFFS